MRAGETVRDAYSVLDCEVEAAAVERLAGELQYPGLLRHSVGRSGLGVLEVLGRATGAAPAGGGPGV